MKKNLKIGIWLLMIFLLSGCEYRKENAEDMNHNGEDIHEEGTTSENSYIKEAYGLCFMAEYATDEGNVSKEVTVDIAPVKIFDTGILYRLNTGDEIPLNRNSI